ncbi:hypothetical protein FPV67DRAFT_1663172 [Lyophyllum atratum]|nr:hypothetical protein FPV67DRAFT_1663172 [Lyophyllum atratum]
MPRDSDGRGRPYERSKIGKLGKAKLVDLVLKQPELWPCKGKSKGINASKTSRKDVLEALLNPEHGFTDQDIAEPPTAADSSQATAATSSAADNPSVSCSTAGVFATLDPALMFHQPQDGMEVVPADPQIKTKDLTLYIEDRRFPEAATYTMEIISVAVADRVGCGPGAWRVSTKEIIVKLQQSHGAINSAQESLRRPVKLGIPEHNDPKSRFTRYFATAVVSELVDTQPSPEYLVVPAGATSQITLCVNWASDALTPPVPLDVHQIASSSTMASSSMIASSSSGPALVKKKKRQPVSREEDVEWLKQIVQSQPGFKAFHDSKGRVLQNPEILRFWDFAVQFKNTYQSTTSGVSDHIITKKSILTALGVRETWFGQAEYGHQLAQLYGGDSDNRAGEVVAELSAHRERPLGQHKLLDFLDDWAERHGGSVEEET